MILKKSDGFILGAFIGPFILTLAVVIFILLINIMTGHLDILLGKGLSWLIFAKLIGYFAFSLVPLALPLAILLASLITFGNLGEHNELTALKASGVSLLRVLRPVFVFAVGLGIFSFWFNDVVVPWANLKAFSLLWDIRQKTPTLSIKEGIFYNDIPKYSIKIKKKLGADGKDLKGVMIYNHSSGQGNSDLIVADSGRMYTINNQKSLVLELYKGKSYHDQSMGNVTFGGTGGNERFVVNQFSKTQLVFSLEAFEMKKTDENLFSSHRYMHNVRRLSHDIDSFNAIQKKYKEQNFQNLKTAYQYHLHKNNDSILKVHLAKIASNEYAPTKKDIVSKSTSIFTIAPPSPTQILRRANQQASNVQSIIKARREQLDNQRKNLLEHYIEFYKKFTAAFACLTMFLIGAPLGAIIKKGGLGIPVLVAIIFFVMWHISVVSCDKWIKEGVLSAFSGSILPNSVLFCFGIYFLRQAKNDSRIFESDYYYVMRDRFLERFATKKA